MMSAAQIKWGLHPMDWPVPPHRLPSWWQFRQRRVLADLEAVFGPLDNAALLRWWRECRKGQSVYEDAGSYFQRCYDAMCGLATEEPLTYGEAAQALALKP